MLTLFKNDGTLIKAFEDDLYLYLYITHHENLKLFPDHPEFGGTPWGFTLLAPDRIARLIQDLQKEYNRTLLCEARDRRLSMIEICEGNYQEITQILITPGVDVASLRAAWCRAWCKEHGLFVAETEA